MIKLFIDTISQRRQCAYSIGAVSLVAVLCYLVSSYIGYHVIAFVLLVAVSLIAMLFDILPVLLAAVLSALVWDFFFIPPYFTFTVRTTEDAIFLMMYLLVALISSALTYKIRQLQKIYRQKEDRANAIKLYNTLLNSLSHELRTPIAIIIGAADNLQQPNAGLTQHYRDELVAEIAKASMKLNHHVDNLLNMSRLESGVVMPRRDWCDIGELIHDIAGKVEEQVTGRRIEVIISPDIPLAQIDKGMLEQILYNLVSNAAIYTPVQCRIVVRAYCDDEVLVMEIEDNGPGFPADEIDKVFDKFYRLKHSVTGGTGLGLSIVKGFAEAMEGDVTLEQIKAGGAKFTVRLPAPLSYLKNLKNE